MFLTLNGWLISFQAPPLGGAFLRFVLHLGSCSWLNLR